MLASPELQTKLLHRLRLQHEDALSSPRRKLLQPQELSSTPKTPVSVEALRKQIQEALRQRDEAVRRQHEIEAESVRRGREAAAEIANLRLQTQEMQTKVASTKKEVQQLRRSELQELRRRRGLEAAAQKVLQAAAHAEAQQEKIAAEVSQAEEEKRQLEQQMKSLESLVSQQIQKKLRLQEKLSECHKREAELRHTLSEATEEAARRTYSLHSDDEPEVDSGDKALGDLEFSYEGLELSNVMPLGRALRLASRWTESAPSSGLANVAAESKQNLWPTESTNSGDEDSQYQEPMNDLIQALAEMKDLVATQTASEPALPVPEVYDHSMEQYHINVLREAVEELRQHQEKPPEPKAPGASEASEASEAELSAMPVVSGFSFFSPYAALTRKYAKF
ncbi:unnamed protein product [Effrenium voratum]|nr:unnamed protein product [Effrenium voratum]